MQNNSEKHRLMVRDLVDDLGGAAKLAKTIGVPRTAPYRWMRRRYVSSSVLEKIKDAHPKLNLDKYFTTTGDGEGNGDSICL